MCGIVGYVGSRKADQVLMSGLRKLEYRGYDSAGVATLDGGVIHVSRQVGKLENLDRELAAAPHLGTIGIGHTRWATHGRPSELNAHPHRVGAEHTGDRATLAGGALQGAGEVAVIHNGIIENYLELRAELSAEGRRLASETDTEVIAHLIHRELAAGRDLAAATRATIARLEGSFAIVVLASAQPDRLVAAKNATPVVIGVGQGENFVASDIPALLDYTRDVLFLEDGEIAVVTRESVAIQRFDGTPVEREPRHVTWDPITAQKGGYKHFLLKEIHEQPQALIDTMRGRIAEDRGSVVLPELEGLSARIREIERVCIVACGSAWHAAQIGKFLLERLARIPTEVDYGSEFRYRDPVLNERTLLLVISQSGETADTLAAVDAARQRRAPVLAICNVVDSSIARKADAVLYTHAGPEISVASTKAFTTQLVACSLLGAWLGRARGTLAPERESQHVHALMELPQLIGRCLELELEIAAIARSLAGASDTLYLGRGVNYPIALEGALKLKDISYVHAEGYPAGEMKHGPIALIDERMPVVVLIPRDEVFGKTMSNLKEVESRGGRIFAITDKSDAELTRVAEAVIEVPSTVSLLMPVLLTIPLQLLAYHVAVDRGTDVDQPRNLAKSVTVE